VPQRAASVSYRLSRLHHSHNKLVVVSLFPKKDRLVRTHVPQNKRVGSNQCMSFVPAPQQAIAASANVPNPAVKPAGAATAVAVAEPEVSDQELLFKLRTFDVYWVDKTALMYRDGIAKVRYVI
jgi:hypothetical protein